MKSSMRSILLTTSISVSRCISLSGQETDKFHQMRVWPFSEKGGDIKDSLVIRGVATRKGDLQTTGIAALKANPGNIRYHPQPDNWIELKRVDGQWDRGPVDLEISKTDPSLQKGDWVCGWTSGLIGHGSYVGYRLYVKGKFFAEEYFKEAPEPPEFQIIELDSDHITFTFNTSVRFEGIDCNFDWSHEWAPVRITNSRSIPLEMKSVHPYPTDTNPSRMDITLKVTHPLLLRITAYRDMQRYVGYYLMGKGYVSGPKEAGALDDFVPHALVHDSEEMNH